MVQGLLRSPNPLNDRTFEAAKNPLIHCRIRPVGTEVVLNRICANAYQLYRHAAASVTRGPFTSRFVL